MAKVLSSISLDSPASPLTPNVSDTFSFAGTPSFAGGGGVQRYDWKWEVDDGLGGGYVTIGASGTGLITADTNPITNSNSQTQNAITVTCDQAGSYTIRMAGAPSTGGSYTVFSATQTVEVSAPANVTVTPDTAALTTAAFAPTVSVSNNQTATPGVLALATATFAPTVSVTDHQLVTPGAAALSLSGLVPTVSATAHQTVTPGVASLTLTGLVPTVTGGAGLTVTPSTASLTLAAFAPTVSTSDHKVVTPGVASLSLAAFAPTVTGGAGLTVTPGAASLSLSAFAPTVTASANVQVTPGLLELSLSAFAPTVTASGAAEELPDNPSTHPILLPKGVEDDREFERFARVAGIEADLEDIARFVDEVEASGDEFVDVFDHDPFTDRRLFGRRVARGR